ncbi:MAG: FMN-binding protein, partial [Clostridia bacterium]|nr:FMN-binding protein [Clostridia bacterium]
MKKQLPAWLVLFIIALAAGLLLAGTNELTKDRIYEQSLIAANAAREKVLPQADAFEALHEGDENLELDNCYVATANGEVIGYVGQVTVSGYGGNIEVVAGIDTAGVITGISVGGSEFSETAGLGAKTREAGFTDQFAGVVPPVRLNNNVDSVTGASISSGAVVAGVNRIATHIIEVELGIVDEDEAAPVWIERRSTTARGFGGDVEVTVYFGADGTISDVEVSAPNETEGLGKLAEEDYFTDQFTGKTGSVDLSDEGIDALTGATITSQAVIDAINELLTEEVVVPEEMTALARGFGGDVEVRAIFNSAGQLASLEVSAPNETAGLGMLAEEDDFTDQFLGLVGPYSFDIEGVDALSGATVTSNAVIEALNSIAPVSASQVQDEKAQTEPEVEEPVVEPEPEPEDPNAIKATARGFAGDVEVAVTVNEDNSIATLTIKAASETPGFGLRAEEPEFAEQFIGKTAPFAYGDGIDAIAGATMTSNAVIEALNSLFAAEEAEPV